MRILLALLVLLASNLADAACLSVGAAWIRQAPPGATTMAGFADFSSIEDEAVVVDASSADFERVEIHEMKLDQGVMRMRKLPGLTVPAGGQMSLLPGGNHLMLFGPRRALAAGDKVSIEFVLSDGSTLPVEFDVRTQAPADLAQDPH